MVLAAGELALTTRLTRAGVLEALATDYTLERRAPRACRNEPWSATRCATRCVPLVTVVGARAGMVVTGAVLVETVFAWPGLGQLLLSSIQTRDVPVLLGLFLFASTTVIVANLVTDLAYAWLDPRIRYEVTSCFGRPPVSWV